MSSEIRESETPLWLRYWKQIDTRNPGRYRHWAFRFTLTDDVGNHYYLYSDFTANNGICIHLTDHDERNDHLVSSIPDSILYDPFHIDSYKTKDLLDVLENKSGRIRAYDVIDCNCHDYVKVALTLMPLRQPTYYELINRIYFRKSKK